MRDFKEHMEKSARKAASIPLTMPSRPVGLPPDGLYIHLNGEAKGPFTVEQIKAEFENGVLSIHIPKAALPQPKRIQIGGAMQQKQQAAVGSGNVSNQQSKSSGQKSTSRERENERMAAQSR